MALHRRLPKAAASVALPAASLLTAAVISVAPVQAQTSGSAAELKVLSPRAGDAVGSNSFSMDVSFRSRSQSAPIVTAELWVDGVRWVRQNLATPQTNNVLKFDVDGSTLSAGTHDVVVKVFASNGAVSQAQVSVQAGNDNGVSTGAFSGPEMAFMSPGNGKTVSGTIELNLNAKERNGKNPYVTFYVDKQFKTLKNYPPYTYEWDTTQVSNGYHTIEATGYLDSNDTSTTCRLKVYVDNAGGNTVRLPEIPDLRGKTPRVPTAAAVAAGVKPLNIPTPKTDAQAVLPAPLSPSVASRETLKPIPAENLLSSDTVMVMPIAPSSVATPATRRAPIAAKTLAPAAPRVEKAEKTAVKPQSAPIAVPVSAVKAVALPAPTAAPTVAAPRMANVVSPAHTAVSSIAPKADGVVAVHRAVAAPQIGGEKFSPRPMNGIHRTAASSRIHISAGAPRAIVQPMADPFLMHPIQVAFDGDRIAFDVQPRVEAGLPIAPFRQIFEHTGGQVEWIPSTKVVRAVNSDHEIVIKVGKNQAMVNGETVKMDRSAFVERGRTIVPLSFVGKALNVDVKYDPVSGRLQITSR